MFKSIDVTDVPKGERLIVNTVTFNPSPVRSRGQSITVTITVKDTRGYFVRNAYVFLRSTPIVTSTPSDAQTATDGKITYSVVPESDFPIKNGYSVQFYVKAYRKGDPSLAGVSGTRLDPGADGHVGSRAHGRGCHAAHPRPTLHRPALSARMPRCERSLPRHCADS